MIPGTLRILGKTWEISEAPTDFTDSGSCNRDYQKIVVVTSQPEENIKDTLLHEVLHAVDYCMATKLTEDQVAALATGLLAVFLDNPTFLEFLNAGITRGNLSSTKNPRRKARQSSKVRSGPK